MDAGTTGTKREVSRKNYLPSTPTRGAPVCIRQETKTPARCARRQWAGCSYFGVILSMALVARWESGGRVVDTARTALQDWLRKSAKDEVHARAQRGRRKRGSSLAQGTCCCEAKGCKHGGGNNAWGVESLRARPQGYATPNPGLETL
ncbi:hypothetical protein EJ02DRAFT_54133 [Clathrospora elynae]|uniref:Uncharacterized protein n=1 Tax=Clathrospora elynae TaxID=706981 RepID=A0A6A5T095_9PLEO|nr:hypothetical protein EJ02DRAFT_54133 [Clathrospora elynae]